MAELWIKMKDTSPQRQRHPSLIKPTGRLHTLGFTNTDLQNTLQNIYKIESRDFFRLCRGKSTNL